MLHTCVMNGWLQQTNRASRPYIVSTCPHSSHVRITRHHAELHGMATSGNAFCIRKAACRQKNSVCMCTDYIASASDDGVLRLPARSELEPEDITHVFGYPRNFGEQYTIGKLLGAGSFGVVHECIHKESGARYAVKSISKIPKNGPCTPRYLLKLRNEVDIMQQLGNSFDAVNLADVFEDSYEIHLVMELCEGGALLERVGQHTYSEQYISRLIRSILRFISQCHAKGIIYRDVKPDNFLFLNTSEDSPLKATDFGLSIRHWSDEPKLVSRSGTPAYMSPELIQQHYDEKCDLWSVGMLSYQLLTGRFPFWEDIRSKSLNDVWKSILGEEVNWNAPELATLSPLAVDFLQRLLEHDPELRPGAKEALAHPWFHEANAAPHLPLDGSVVQRLQRFATYSHLKQLVLQMILEELEEEVKARKPNVSPLIAALQDLFDQFDEDHSGSISFDELCRGLKAQGYAVLDSEMQQIMRTIDFDHDGKLNLHEFMAVLLDWEKLEKENYWQLYVEHAFARLDIDCDGYLSLDELLSRLQSTPSLNAAEQRVQQAKLMLREADLNGDGKISKQEFFDLLQHTHAPDSLSFYDQRLATSAVKPAQSKSFLQRLKVW